MEQEALLALRHQAIDHLLIVDAAEGHDAESLRLASREEHRTVHARQHANLDRDRADRRVIAAVSATTLEDRLALTVLDGVADDLTGDLAPLHLLGIGAAGRGWERLRCRFLGDLDCSAALLLRTRRQRGATQLVAELRFDRSDEFLVELRRSERRLLAAGESAQFFDQCGDVARGLVAQLERFEHDLFADFLGAGLDHHHRVFAAGNGQVQLVLRRLDLAPQRVDDELVIAHADAAHAERRPMRNRTQCQRCKACNRGDDVWIVLAIRRKHLRQDLDLGLVAVWEHRPHRAVDEAAAKDLLGRRPAFALEEAAGDHACGRGLLAVVDGEREEVDVVAGLLTLCGRKNHGFAVRDDHGAVGLTRHSARLDRQLATADLALHANRLRNATRAHRHGGGGGAGARCGGSARGRFGGASGALGRRLCRGGLGLLGARACAGASAAGATALAAAGLRGVVGLLLACHSRSRCAACLVETGGSAWSRSLGRASPPPGAVARLRAVALVRSPCRSSVSALKERGAGPTTGAHPPGARAPASAAHRHRRLWCHLGANAAVCRSLIARCGRIVSWFYPSWLLDAAAVAVAPSPGLATCAGPACRRAGCIDRARRAAGTSSACCGG